MPPQYGREEKAPDFVDRLFPGRSTSECGGKVRALSAGTSPSASLSSSRPSSNANAVPMTARSSSVNRPLLDTGPRQSNRAPGGVASQTTSSSSCERRRLTGGKVVGNGAGNTTSAGGVVSGSRGKPGEVTAPVPRAPPQSQFVAARAREDGEVTGTTDNNCKDSKTVVPERTHRALPMSLDGEDTLDGPLQSVPDGEVSSGASRAPFDGMLLTRSELRLSSSASAHERQRGQEHEEAEAAKDDAKCGAAVEQSVVLADCFSSTSDTNWKPVAAVRQPDIGRGQEDVRGDSRIDGGDRVSRKMQEGLAVEGRMNCMLMPLVMDTELHCTSVQSDRVSVRHSDAISSEHDEGVCGGRAGPDFGKVGGGTDAVEDAQNCTRNLFIDGISAQETDLLNAIGNESSSGRAGHQRVGLVAGEGMEAASESAIDDEDGCFVHRSCSSSCSGADVEVAVGLCDANEFQVPHNVAKGQVSDFGNDGSIISSIESQHTEKKNTSVDIMETQDSALRTLGEVARVTKPMIFELASALQEGNVRVASSIVEAARKEVVSSDNLPPQEVVVLDESMKALARELFIKMYGLEEGRTSPPVAPARISAVAVGPSFSARSVASIFCLCAMAVAMWVFGPHEDLYVYPLPT